MYQYGLINFILNFIKLKLSVSNYFFSKLNYIISCFILIYIKKYYLFSVQMPMTMNDEYLGFPAENRIQRNGFRESNRLMRRDCQVRIIYNFLKRKEAASALYCCCFYHIFPPIKIFLTL